MMEFSGFSGNAKTDLQMLASLGVRKIFGKEKKCFRLIRGSMRLSKVLKLDCKQIAVAELSTCLLP